jgi:tRNA modification GTPase
VAELHTIGSPPLIAAALEQICRCGARLAAPGEFTLRAFLAGRLDLPQAEAVLAVIDAHDDRHLHTALAQLAGGLSQPLNDLRDQLLDLLAELEAGLDFVEEDIEFITQADLGARVSAAYQMTGALIDKMSARSIDHHDYRAVLTGAPNVGKSSLLNAIAERSAAIVSEQAGTTRDYVSTTLELDGVECSLLDTAGVDRSDRISGPDLVAQDMTTEQIEQAHLCLICLDASRPLNAIDRQILARHADTDMGLIVLTKADLPPKLNFDADTWQHETIHTSSTTGTGLAELKRAIRTRLVGGQGNDAVVASTAARCRESLRRTADSLRRARDLVATATGDEFVATELRVALDELGQVVGATYTDDILDRIFGRFCIGK